MQKDGRGKKTALNLEWQAPPVGGLPYKSDGRGYSSFRFGVKIADFAWSHLGCLGGKSLYSLIQV